MSKRHTTDILYGIGDLYKEISYRANGALFMLSLTEDKIDTMSKEDLRKTIKEVAEFLRYGNAKSENTEV